MQTPQQSNKESFRLSDPGATLAMEPRMLEYLREYHLPAPPAIRYGCLRLQSPQKNYPVTLFGQAWLPPHAEATVVLLHGYAEHGGNYSQLIQDLVKEKLAVIAMDFRGHGLSEGARAHVDKPEHYAEDLEYFLSTISATILPNRPLFLWGHSMGGLVALQLIARKKLPAEPQAVVITSPLLGFPEVKGLQKFAATIAPYMAKIFPSLPIPHGLSESWLSHDQSYLQRRKNDPLITNHTTPRWFIAMHAAVAQLNTLSHTFSSACPILCLLAGDERIANLQSARKFSAQALTSRQHQTIEFPGMLHELEKEPAVRDRILSESLAWYRRILQK